MTQLTKPILLAPGPTEVDPAVLNAMATSAESHFAQPFADTFGNTLTMLRTLFQTEDPRAQPFVIGGSGSLGWDFVATNFIEKDDKVLCLSTGFFSDAFAECIATYGAQTNKMTVPVGMAHDLWEVEQELRSNKYKALVATHVETSTAVLTPLKPLSDLIRRVSPETLFVVDGVASIGAEEFYFDAWNVDVVVTGSQKALSCPPGLSIIMTSARALSVVQSRSTPVSTWYASLPRWLPIMQTYERKEVGYFATPPTQLVHALHAALKSILSQPLQQRWQQHLEQSRKVKAVVAKLGLTQLVVGPSYAANGLTAFWLPVGLTSKEFLAMMTSKGFVLSGGMHKEVGQKYARFGHMGYSPVSEPVRHIDRGIEAMTDCIAEHYANQAEKLAKASEYSVHYEYSTRSDGWAMDGQKVLDLGIEVV